MGFSCVEGDEGYQVGPFAVGEKTTEADVEQMYQYMIRTWVEVTLYLQAFQRSNGEGLRL